MQTESLDKQGNVVSTSTTETTSVLTGVDRDRCTLRVDVLVEVAGKRFAAESKLLTLSFLGEAADPNISVRKKTDGQLSIGGQTYPVEVREITVQDKSSRRVSTVHYSRESPPHELRRVTTATSPDGRSTTYETQVEVVAVDMPYKVLHELRPTTIVRTLHTQGKTTTVTVEVHAAGVPGGVVSHTSKELNEAGQIVRRSTLELLDCGPTGRTRPAVGRMLHHKYYGIVPN